MVKVSFVSTVSILAPIQVRQTIRALFRSSVPVAERDLCACDSDTGTSEYRSSDSDHARGAMVSAARSSSPRPSPQPSGRQCRDTAPGHVWSPTRLDLSIASDSKHPTAPSVGLQAAFRVLRSHPWGTNKAGGRAGKAGDGGGG